MPKVALTKHRCDGSGRKRTMNVETDVWHKSSFDGSFGKQPQWYYVAIDPLGTIIARATIYEDRNEARCIIKGKRLYRWDVFPPKATYSYARGETVSLAGAKLIAEACMGVSDFCKPYNESKHRR
jgi:hypothetical protein